MRKKAKGKGKGKGKPEPKQQEKTGAKNTQNTKKKNSPKNSSNRRRKNLERGRIMSEMALARNRKAAAAAEAKKQKKKSLLDKIAMSKEKKKAQARRNIQNCHDPLDSKSYRQTLQSLLRRLPSSAVIIGDHATAVTKIDELRKASDSVDRSLGLALCALQVPGNPGVRERFGTSLQGCIFLRRLLALQHDHFLTTLSAKDVSRLLLMALHWLRHYPADCDGAALWNQPTPQAYRECVSRTVCILFRALPLPNMDHRWHFIPEIVDKAMAASGEYALLAVGTFFTPVALHTNGPTHCYYSDEHKQHGFKMEIAICAAEASPPLIVHAAGPCLGSVADEDIAREALVQKMDTFGGEVAIAEKQYEGEPFRAAVSCASLASDCLNSLRSLARVMARLQEFNVLRHPFRHVDVDSNRFSTKLLGCAFFIVVFLVNLDTILSSKLDPGILAGSRR